MFNSERPTFHVVSIENSKTESVLNEIFGVIVFNSISISENRFRHTGRNLQYNVHCYVIYHVDF